MKKISKIASLIIGIGFATSLFSCSNQPDVPPKPIEDHFSIACDRDVFYLEENDVLMISIDDNYVLNNHKVGDANLSIEQNNCSAIVSRSGNGWTFRAYKYGTATLSARIGDLKSSNSLTIKALYSDNKIKDNFQAALDTEGGVVFGQSYDLGLSTTYDSEYTLSGADGILEINESGLLEVKGIGQGKVKLLKDGIDLIECRYTVFNSTLATRIKRDLILKGKIDSLSSLVPNSLLQFITDLDLSGELINDPTSSYGIKYLTELKTLNLSSNNLSDASFISSLSKLETLDLSNNSFTDISSIVENENLKVLNLKDNQLNKITNLQYLYNIEYLDLSNNSITNISPLSSSYSLKALFLNNNKVTNFKDSLSGLENLTELGLGNCGISFTDVVSLKYLPNIEYLDISGTKPTLKTIGTTLKKLNTLVLENCDLNNVSTDDSLSYLNQLSLLQTLNIASNGLDLEKWVGIDGLPLIKGENLSNLSSLYLGGNEFNVFPDLSSFASLKLLDVSESFNLSDISSLVSLNIETLVLDNCNSISNDNFAGLILSNKSIKKLSTIGAFNYLQKSEFDALVSSVSSGDLSWRFMDEIWTTSETVYNYSRVVYFSLSDLLARGTNAVSSSINSYEFKGDNGQEIIVSFVNDMGNLADTHYSFSVPKEIYRIQIYGNKYYSYDMSFQIQERKESSITFNLYNYKNNVSAKNGDVISSLSGSKVFINSLAGENVLKGGDGHVIRNSEDNPVFTEAGSAINGYDVKINAKRTSTISLLGGKGGKGPGHNESGTDEPSGAWKGLDGGNGAHAIVCHDCELMGGLITIRGGDGGDGGAATGNIFEPWPNGNGGDGGCGIYYSGEVVDNSSSTILGGNGGTKGMGYDNGRQHNGSNGTGLKKAS